MPPSVPTTINRVRRLVFMNRITAEYIFIIPTNSRAFSPFAGVVSAFNRSYAMDGLVDQQFMSRSIRLF